MTTTTLPSVAERVAAGAALLDERQPGWHDRIDLDRLDLASDCECVLGQLHGGYGYGKDVNRITGMATFALGFNTLTLGPAGEAELDALTAAWRELIETRRAAS